MEENIKSNRRKIYWSTAVYLAILVGISGLFVLWMLSIGHNTTTFAFLMVFIIVNCLLIYIAVHGGLYAIAKLSQTTAADDSEFAQIRNAVDDIALAAGITAPELMLLDVGSCNAFSLSVGENGAIFFTRGLAGNLDQDELRAVMGHEIAHLYNEDATMNTVVASLRGFSLLIDLLLSFTNCDLSYDVRASLGPLTKGVLLAMVGFLTVALASLHKLVVFPAWLDLALIILLSMVINLLCLTLFGYAVQKLMNPSRELYADELCVKWTMDPESLVKAIEKAVANSALYSLSFLKAAFFIAPHFTDTQPTPADRIRHLEEVVNMKL